MKLVSTTNHSALVELRSTDCFRLSEAFQIAAKAAEEEGRYDLLTLWETSTALFEALGTLANIESRMPGGYSVDRTSFDVRAARADAKRDLEPHTGSEEAA